MTTGRVAYFPRFPAHVAEDVLVETGSKYAAESLALNHCFAENKGVARWLVTVAAPDEFLVVLGSGGTSSQRLASFLDQVTAPPGVDTTANWGNQRGAGQTEREAEIATNDLLLSSSKIDLFLFFLFRATGWKGKSEKTKQPWIIL